MTTIPEGWPSDEMIEAGASALAAHGLHTGTAHVWSRVVLKAALAAAPPTVSDMQAFGASDAACYKWPGDTPEHKALRAAYIAGAADVFPAAAPAPPGDARVGDVVNHEEATELAQMKCHESNLARCYLDLRATNARMREACANVDRFFLVIESAVRNADLPRHKEVIGALKQLRVVLQEVPPA